MGKISKEKRALIRSMRAGEVRLSTAVTSSRHGLKTFFVSQRTSCYGRRTTKLATKQALIFTVMTYKSICNFVCCNLYFFVSRSVPATAW